MKEVVFEEGSKLRTIGEDAFYGCRSLEKICLPTKLTSITDHAFSKYKNLKRVLLPDGLQK